MRIRRGFYLLLLVTLPLAVVLATVWLLIEASSRTFAAETSFYLATSGSCSDDCSATLSPCVATHAAHSFQNISLDELYPLNWRRIKNSSAVQAAIVPAALILCGDASGTDIYASLDRQIGQPSSQIITLYIFSIWGTRRMGESKNTMLS